MKKIAAITLILALAACEAPTPTNGPTNGGDEPVSDCAPGAEFCAN